MGYAITKRILDLALVTIFGLILSPVLLLAAIAIKLDSKGPIFSKQKRVGKNGKIITVWKLRTMREATSYEQGGKPWTERDDPRITRVGRILRKTHFDEVPQFWNILKGEMSVVGPRADLVDIQKTLGSRFPEAAQARLAVLPGMIGWSQVHLPTANSKEDAEKKLEYDLYYLKHRSLWLDLKILFKAVKTYLMSWRDR